MLCAFYFFGRIRLSGRNKVERTSVKRATKEPYWDETLEFDVTAAVDGAQDALTSERRV